MSSIISLLSRGACCAALLALGLPAHAQVNNLRSAEQQMQSDALQDALQRIASNPNNSSALADAGLSALALGDINAAIGFLAKAEQMAPSSGRVKEGLGRALLLSENPLGALRYFQEAVANGIPARTVAADRGLALDLLGRTNEAQEQYALAGNQSGSEDLIHRYAVSLAISGDIEGADAKLNPLLLKQDPKAWRSRAMIYAMNNEQGEAKAIVTATMRPKMAEAIMPFLVAMPRLTPAQKAAAVHLGHFPASENIGVDVASVRAAANIAVRGGSGADAGLIPLGEPLGTDVRKPRVLAMPDKRERRRPGQGDKARDRKAERAKEREQKELARKQQEEVRRKKAAEQKAKDQREREQREMAAAAAAKPPEPIPPKPVGTSANQQRFESAFGVAEPANPPVEIAVATSAPELKTPGFQSMAQPEPSDAAASSEAKPLVSQTVQRKVRIGDVPPSNTESKSIQGTAKPIEIAASSSKAQPSVDVTEQPVGEWVAGPSSDNGPKVVAATPSVPKGTPNLPKGDVTAPVSFDLADTKSTSVSPPTTPNEPAPNSGAPSPSFADMIRSVSIPEDEKVQTVAAVDLSSITPARPKPKVETAAEKPPVPEPPKYPKRYWVQIATGRDVSALRFDYRRMAKANGDLFAKYSGWTSPFGSTRRLVVGPFDSLKQAKSFEADFRKGGGDGFAWVSDDDTEVNPLPGK